MFDINQVVNRMLIYFPVFKLVINNITFKEDLSITTACTNGDTVYYNPVFFMSLNKDEQVFIVAHELMHITLKHLSRQKERNMELWNYATDAVINQILRKCGLPIVEGVIDCPNAINYSAEEYYEIMERHPNIEQILSQYRQPESHPIIATHDRWSEEKEEKATEEMDESKGQLTEKNITEVNKEMVRKENEVFKSGLGQGDMEPTSLEGVGYSKPVIDWKEFLERKKRKIVSVDYNLHAGEFDEEGIYKYPIEVIKKSDIEILIDTSGSVNDDMVRAFLQECKNIFEDFTIKVGCFDTKFYGFQDIKKKEDLDNFKIQGRGGTDFNAAANAFNRKAQVKLIFTDGYADVPDKEDNIIWVVYSDIELKPKGGIVFHVDPQSLTLKGRSR